MVVVLSSLILSVLMMEAIRSSKTSILIRSTGRHIQEDGILHCVVCVSVLVWKFVYLHPNFLFAGL
jgi:hypothetical protein